MNFPLYLIQHQIDRRTHRKDCVLVTPDVCTCDIKDRRKQ